MAKKNGWDRVGELRKTKRADMLVGSIELKELNIKLRVVAFIKTNEQKKNLKEPDIVILLPKDEVEVKVEENIFD